MMKNLIASLAVFVTLLVTTAFAESSPTSAEAYVARGMQRFRSNEVEASIVDFEQAIELDPRVEPYLWQLGISYYYAEKFEQGRDLFASHQAVNRNDVENAAWHFLCVAKLEGVEAAGKQLLPIDTRRDTRVPMREVYEFYAGRGAVAEVLDAARQDGSERAKMYAHLYLGLYHEVKGEKDEARKHLWVSADAKLRNNYMHEVAKVHLFERKWKE